MVDDIQKNGLDGVVVASCSPKLHLLTFQSVAERAGLNKYNYVHANIREQVSWAHSDNKSGATDKAIKIVQSALARVRMAEPLEPFSIHAKKAVAVIGGGIAGMKAAIALSSMGCPVTLIEREHFVGGHTAQWDVLFTSNETGKEMVTRLYNEVATRDNITLYTGAEIINQTGSIGDFRLKIKITPRYIKEKCHKGNLQKAIEACPVEVPDEFNFGITQRKAVYHNFPSEYPQTPVIDIKNCTRCGKCEAICESVDFSQEEKTVEIHVGSVLVAAGFDPYIPAEGEFGYRQLDNVVTLPQFKRIVDLNDHSLVYKEKEIRNIAYIYCVGSRQLEGDNKFCSRYCCTSVIHASIQVRKKFTHINNYHFNRGIRTYGKQELLYNESLKTGDIYLQAYEDDPPVVFSENGRTIVKINDILTGKKEVSVEADLVVLVTGMVPRENKTINTLLKIPRGRDTFYNEIHMKLRPVETVIDGITICGACQGPKNVTESANSALSAATKSYSYISRGELSLDPVIAKINEEKCTWCGLCAAACPYDAIKIKKTGSKEIAVVNDPVCKGCGMCLPVCPADAIELNSYTNREIENMIDALAG
jgi:heterodisulfide reductase subunit A